jgi:hypothetical protein|tara:strand:- start:363 stop:626 length:264 start_codon:yes stop_codon:yes gene_type:complete
MYKIFNFLFLILILIFSLYTYKYYSSDKNLKAKKFNRININQIINEKISKLPVLQNDTNNVIEFNNSLSNEIKIEKPRSFWNLLKSK